MFLQKAMSINRNCAIFLSLVLLLLVSLSPVHCKKLNFGPKSFLKQPQQAFQPVSTISMTSNTLRAGQSSVDIKSTTNLSLKQTLFRNSLGLWGVIQVVLVLANALKRLYPIAVQPFKQQDMLPYQWAMYIAWTLYMVYEEGYKAFQLKFAPLVVERAFGLNQNLSILNVILAGPYSMGMFNASKKRMIVSWAVTTGVFALVAVVKQLPYPYRSIVDAGVVCGLSYGTLSILALTIKVLLGGVVKAPEETVAVAPAEKVL